MVESSVQTEVKSANLVTRVQTIGFPDFPLRVNAVYRAGLFTGMEDVDNGNCSAGRAFADSLIKSLADYRGKCYREKQKGWEPQVTRDEMFVVSFSPSNAPCLSTVQKAIEEVGIEGHRYPVTTFNQFELT